MGVVKIKNLRSNLKTPFSVKGRIKPQPKIYDNLCSKGTHFRAILYDKTSTIQIVAFNADCEIALKQLQTEEVVSIESFEVIKISKGYEIPDHKYQIKFNEKTVVRAINQVKNPKIEFSNFPKYTFTKGNDFETLESGMSVDVVGQIFQDGYKIKVDSIELDMYFRERQTIDVPGDGSFLCIYNATFNRENVKNIIYVVRYSFFKVITPEEYRQLSSVVGDLPVDVQQNGQNITPHRTKEAAGSSESDDQNPQIANSFSLNTNSPSKQRNQNPQIANAPLPNTNSPFKQSDQNPQIANAPLPSTNSPFKQSDQNPQISDTPSPSTSSGNLRSAQKDSTLRYSQLRKRPMQSFENNQNTPKVLKKSETESPLSDENFIRNVHGRLEEFSMEKKQEVQLKILNLIENELRAINNYDDISVIVKLENESD